MLGNQSYILPSNIKPYSSIKRDSNPYGKKSPAEIFWNLLTNLGAMGVGIQKNPDKFGGDVGYYVTHEFLPNSAENRRDEIISKPQKSTQTTKDGKNEKQSYGRYNKLYDKIYGAVYRGKSKLNDYVNSLAKVFKKLRSIYQGTPNFDVKKQPYNPFRKSGLDEKVIEMSRYLSRKSNYQTKSKDYARMIPTPYNNKDESLEEKLAA